MNTESHVSLKHDTPAHEPYGMSPPAVGCAGAPAAQQSPGQGALTHRLCLLGNIAGQSTDVWIRCYSYHLRFNRMQTQASGMSHTGSLWVLTASAAGHLHPPKATQLQPASHLRFPAHLEQSIAVTGAASGAAGGRPAGGLLRARKRHS